MGMTYIITLALTLSKVSYKMSLKAYYTRKHRKLPKIIAIIMSCILIFCKYFFLICFCCWLYIKLPFFVTQIQIRLLLVTWWRSYSCCMLTLLSKWVLYLLFYQHIHFNAVVLWTCSFLYSHITNCAYVCILKFSLINNNIKLFFLIK